MLPPMPAPAEPPDSSRLAPVEVPASPPVASPQPRPRRAALSVAQLVDGVRAGERAVLAQAITLVESARAEHRAQAAELVAALGPFAGGAIRVGITGVPGAGKSTFIDALGCRLLDQGLRVAVLAVDPSSARTGGSILGDKTRMGALALRAAAYIRPSPSGGSLGGVARRTREALLLCEAAGFDVVLVETVGVGQSETEVSEMTDFFLALMIAGAGDELQGIKRGVLELADAIAVNKADGDNLPRANQAAHEYRQALHYLTPRRAFWTPRVLTCSAITGDKLDRVWQAVLDHRAALAEGDRLSVLRAEQAERWLQRQVTQGLVDLAFDRPEFAQAYAEAEAAVRAGRLPPSAAATALLHRLTVHLESPVSSSSG